MMVSPTNLITTLIYNVSSRPQTVEYQIHNILRQMMCTEVRLEHSLGSRCEKNYPFK